MAVKLSQAEYNERRNMFVIGQHWCTKCTQYKPIEEFSKSKSAEFGYYWWCKDCHSKARKNISSVKSSARQYNRELKSYYKNLLGGKCARCGYDKTQVALEFHHIDPDEKDAQVSTIINSNNHSKIMFEIDKCILLCRNCHIELESYCWSAEFVKDKTAGYRIKNGSIVESKNEYWTEPGDRIIYSQSNLLSELLAEG